MTETATNSASVSPTPPPLPEKKKRSWRWLKISVWAALVLVLLLKLVASFSSLDLELTRRGGFLGDDGKALEVTNVGRGPITITDIVINDREECTTTNGPGDKFKPLTLRVGDKKILFSVCQIIRATVRSDQGSGTYTFGR